MPLNIVQDYSKNSSSLGDLASQTSTGVKSMASLGPRSSRSGSITLLKQRLQSLTGTSPGNPSLYSSHSSMDVHSFTTSNDDLAAESVDFAGLDLRPYNEALTNYLIQHGLSGSAIKFKHGSKVGKSALKIFNSSAPKSVQAFLSGTGQILFLPYNPAKKRDQQAEDPADEEGDADEEDSDQEDSRGATPLSDGRPHKPTQHNVANHTFVVIIRLSKVQSLTPVARARYFADATTNWVSGIYIDDAKGRPKVSFKEKYKVSKNIDWELDLRNPDCFIPFKSSDNEQENVDELNFDLVQDAESQFTSSTKNSAEIYTSPTQTQELRYFEPLNPKDYINEIENGKDIAKHEDLFSSVDADPRNFNPGYYVFLLPVVYPLNTPETVRTPLASIGHNFSLQLESAQYIPTIPPPPTALLSVSPHHAYEDVDMVGSNIKTGNSVGSKSIFKKLGKRRSSSVSSANTVTAHKSSSNPIYEFLHELPVVRLPPSDATSTLNKSIYVNKIWSDALNYELLLPKKFIQLSPRSGVSDAYMKNTTFVLQMKLIPLIKNLCLKRVKINIVEKITHISRDKKHETESGSADRSGVKERKVTLMEIKTKDKTSPNVLKTQIVKGCANDNLLTCCYNNGKHPEAETRSRSGSLNNLHVGSKRMAKLLDSSKDSTSTSASFDQDDVSITNPVKLQCPLKFVANDETKLVSEIHESLTKSGTDYTEQESESAVVDDEMSIFSVSSNGTTEHHEEENSGWLSKSPILSPILGPKKTGNQSKIISKEEDRSNDFCFYPDTNFHNITIKHRLQVCFRISKPDSDKKDSNGDPKMHHFEVIVDTPIVFVSPFCVQDNLQLPSYEYAVRSSVFEPQKSDDNFSFSQIDDQNKDIDEDLPTFEEAVVLPSSPMMSGYNVPNNLSTTFNSTTMLSQSPFSLGSSPMLDGQSISTNLSGLNLNAKSDANFNNLDSLLQTADVEDNQMFTKKDIKPNSAGGQLSSLLKPQSKFDAPPLISINGKFEYGNQSHVPSRSSLAYYEDDLPSYQTVMEQDTNNLTENLALLSDEEQEGDETFHMAQDNQSLGTLDLNTVPAQANRILD
ncbi:hypothetical protein OGAPHI_006155 [Ogataea philodendri]|uniref:Arrestin C-terminal-like domain-containing protein n=1 Tax=Ogataea philodendri TaxID=1378263 RepID=A0A9P8NZ91_9ASCO|nr:uncharacterized protein OGAPHI_006155 [Ogataea philodendri]KAH3661976.1 hypothetical protein OGAPHI_006155 [Ogataea philodendri]